MSAMTTLSRKCPFCSIPKTRTTKFFKAMYGSLPHTLNIPELPPGFTVLQDLVPIAEKGAHLLLMPNTHFISLATVNNQKGLRLAVRKTVDSLRKYFPDNPIFLFEHGPGFIGNKAIACGGCHLDHAHGHFVVLPKGAKLSSIKMEMERVLISGGWTKPTSYTFFSDNLFSKMVEVVGINPYLCIGMLKDGRKITSFVYPQKIRPIKIPSQLLRMVISMVVYHQPNPDYWHWKDVQTGLISDKRRKEIIKNVLSFRKITGF